MNVAL